MNNIFIIQQKLHQQQHQQQQPQQSVKKVEEKSNSLNKFNNNNKISPSDNNSNSNNNNINNNNVSFSASTSSPAPSSPKSNTFINKNKSPTSASPVSTINNIKKNVTTTSISSISTTPNIITPKKSPPPVPPRNFTSESNNNNNRNNSLPKKIPPPVPPKPINYMEIVNKNNNDNSNISIKIEVENKNNNIETCKDSNNDKKEEKISIVTPPPPITTTLVIKNNNNDDEYSTQNISVTPPALESIEFNSPEYNSLNNSLPKSFNNNLINICNTPPSFNDSYSEQESPTLFNSTPNISVTPSPIESGSNSPPSSLSPSTSNHSLSSSLEFKNTSASKPPRDPNSSPIFVKRSVSIVENLNQKSLLSPNNHQHISNNINTKRSNSTDDSSSGCIAPPPSPSSTKILVNQSLSTSSPNVISSSEEGNTPPRRELTRRAASSNLLKDNQLKKNDESGRQNVFVMSNSSYNLRGDPNDDDEYVDTTNIFRRPVSQPITPPPTPNKIHQRTHSLEQPHPNNRESVNYSASAFNLRDSFEKIIPGITKNEIRITLLEKLEVQHAKIKDKPPRKLKLPSIDSTTKLNKRIAEMIETEADYIDDLEITLNLYLFAFTEMEKLKVISQNDIKAIFSNIEEVYHVSLKLFPMLLKTIPLLEQKQYPNIEEIFLNNYKAFQRYGNYLSSYESSNKYLENLIEKNENVKFVIDYIKNKLPKSKLLDLHAYQIKPCQRLCKYPLLLKDAKSAVPESEESHHKTFERAVKLMEKIVNDINGKITNDEKIQAIIKEVGKEIETLIHHQTFIKECKVKKLKKNNTCKNITVYLLDQYLILYEKGMLKKKYKLISFSKISRVCDHECKSPNSFGIYYSREGGGTTKTLSLQLDSNKEKTDLMNLVDETLQSFKYISGDNNKFLYITNDNINFNNGFNTISKNSYLNTNNNNNNKQKNSLDIAFF